eukprot:TRINITY_DN15823_c0_g2_i1.p1 TRINITY_DN15823_c0_g2~~TRINITY_DN15823_c0_g2_i1.p1  ORF type:complete len:677 (+),score=162.98 TRINITY_DN15823_c0_g2_i1:52-2031(+)
MAPFDGKRSKDPSTLAETVGPARARVVHHDLDLTIDFVGQRLIGYTDAHCICNEAAENGDPWELVLDAADNLVVTDVQIDGKSLEKSQWSRDEARKHEVLGTALRVTLAGGAAGQRVVVRIFYETAAPDDKGEGGSTALQWLPPSQTAGKKFPYMFSQCQAIHARAMLPCQDTCECKATYNATVRCPAELNVLMSAIKTAGPEPAAEPEWETPEGCSRAWTEHKFEQKLPIPVYLIAIACGELESRRVGPRSQVWSEPSMVEASAWEFADTEKLIAAGENLCGPYKWGVYDLLVLPPSFPYGGMENPCLTFVTPTLLAKDKSQVSVVAHEIAHSWSGNLVTNETWEHFWLNEGLTVFTECKIVRDVFGEEEALVHMAGEFKSLVESVNQYGKDHNFTRLVPDLTGGIDPDDAFSTVPYIKGMCLFAQLQDLVGGEAKFQPFVKSYFEHFGGKTVTSEQMRDYFLKYFGDLAQQDSDIATALAGPIAALDWQTLFTAPGMPEYMPSCVSPAVDEAKALAAKWEKSADSPEALASFTPEDIKGWGSGKLVVFLDALLEDTEHGGGQLSAAACAHMAKVYSFLTANCELRCRFLRLALGAKWEGAVDTARDLMATQGRMKFTRPIFRALKAYDQKLAETTFCDCRNGLNPIAVKMVSRDLGV